MFDVWEWLSGNYIELIAAILGLWSLYFQIKQKIWVWPISIAVVLLYIVVFFKSKLYADMSLQFYYLVVSVYGWWLWLHGGEAEKNNELIVSHTSPRLQIILTLLAVFFYFLLEWILRTFTDSDVPRIDAFTTALSFIATWMLARKKLGNWLVWIIVDAVSAGVYIYKELYATTILFIVLTVMAFYGYFAWKKDLENESL